MSNTALNRNPKPSKVDYYKRVKESEMTTMTQAQKIAELNDAFRASGKVYLTPWVRSLNNPFGLILKVREFSDFNENNDPYGEHDFGKVSYEGQEFFWKIDYYDSSMEYGSDDPSDSSVTTRVLTIMHTSEY